LLNPGGLVPPFQPVFWPWLQPGGLLAVRRPGLLNPRGVAALICGPPPRRAPGTLGGGTGGAGGIALDPPPGPPPPGPPRAKAGVVMTTTAAIVAAIAALAKIERMVGTYPAAFPKSGSAVAFNNR
jgi:hypothetical protein